MNMMHAFGACYDNNVLHLGMKMVGSKSQSLDCSFQKFKYLNVTDQKLDLGSACSHL